MDIQSSTIVFRRLLSFASALVLTAMLSAAASASFTRTLPARDSITSQTGTATISTTSTTVTISSLPNIYEGWIRVKVSGLGASTIVGIIRVTGTNGTTAFVLGIAPANSVAAQGVDYRFPFYTDVNLTSISAIVAVSGAITTGTVDVQVQGGTP